MSKRKLTLLTAISLGMALPVTGHAQETPETAQTDTDIDPARMSAAQKVVDSIWPLGTYRKMMDGTMDQMMDSMFESMFDMRASDVVKAGGVNTEDSDETLAEVIEEKDPHFRERMKITTDVMMREMIPLMEKIEPSMRENMAQIYASRFSLAELNDLNVFFATPTGKSYAAESLLIFTDPKFMESMQAFVPEFLSAMPDIMKKVEEETAHLPQPAMDEETGE